MGPARKIERVRLRKKERVERQSEKGKENK